MTKLNRFIEQPGNIAKMITILEPETDEENKSESILGKPTKTNKKEEIISTNL